jgi:hypothetical protein
MVSKGRCLQKRTVGRWREMFESSLVYAKNNPGCFTRKGKCSSPQSGKSNSWIFQSPYVQFLIMCRCQSSSPVFHACTQISPCCRETSRRLRERIDVLLTILSPQAQARGRPDILSVHLVCLGNTCAPESSSQARLR